MDFLPLFFDIRNRPCLVVGGGEVAARKVSMLLRAGAAVTVISPELAPALARLAADNQIRVKAREFASTDLVDCVLVIAATDDQAVNRRVSVLARARNVPVNVVDQPALCSVVMPAIVDRSPVIVAVSAGGASPVLSRLLRARLESVIPAAYGRLALLAQSFRERVRKKVTDVQLRRRFWERVLQGPTAELVLAGQEDVAAALLEQELEQEGKARPQGEVYLVGAGPGDPDLVTFRALRLMQQAEVVVYDRLVAPAILDMTRRDAERVYVGKERNNHAVPQEGINQMLVRLAREGKRVLRLKGGDPFIFGRGGEELETLAQEGIPFQVVPGITAASGCASYAGIPLTHRDYAHACVFVTGHLKDGTLDLNWQALAQPNQTVVVYMGLHGIDIICEQLIEHGLPASTPAALVQQGTTQNQRVVIGDLQALPELVERARLSPPTLLIIGEVVRLHDKLAWFTPAAVADAPATVAKKATG
jgi:uroporphyrin-III C-methyltransferase/precorrin-2 dehydrogenase/sirohydrochlorin ferrochelatase